MEKVEFAPGLFGYVAGPEDAPGLIVIQEWWGVNDTIKELAVSLSQWGPYRVLIPDLYKGKIGVTAEEASHLMNNLDFQQAAGELRQAATYLRNGPGGKRRKVGVTGFCMGGALSFIAGCVGADVDCLAPFYGTPDARWFQIENIKLPILGQFGEKDQYKGFSDPETARAAEKKVKDAGGDFTLVLLPTGDHGFFNLLVPQGKAIQESMGRFATTDEDLQRSKTALLDFLKKHLH